MRQSRHARTLAPGIIALICLVGVVGFLFHHRQRHATATRIAPADQGNADLATTAALNQSPPPITKRLANQGAVEQLRAAVTAARKQRQLSRPAMVGSGAQAALSQPTEAETIGGDYVRAAVKDIVPLVAECYDRAIERDANIAGTIVVKFTIVGEPSVGGIIDNSAIDADATTIRDPQMQECVQETMHAIQIDPPAHGGQIAVTYPFAFSH